MPPDELCRKQHPSRPPLRNPKSPKSRRLLIATIIFSAALHAAAIVAAMPRDTAEQFGTLADKSDTISLSMIQSVVLESISTDVSQMAAAASAASQAGGVQSAESKPQELAEVNDVPVFDQPQPKPVKVADVTPAAVAPTEDCCRSFAVAASRIRQARLRPIGSLRSLSKRCPRRSRPKRTSPRKRNAKRR